MGRSWGTIPLVGGEGLTNGSLKGGVLLVPVLSVLNSAATFFQSHYFYSVKLVIKIFSFHYTFTTYGRPCVNRFGYLTFCRSHPGCHLGPEVH